MGKQKPKDRLFITAAEWARDFGGKKHVRPANSDLGLLPFDHCALSLAPCTSPVFLGSKSGIIFDLDNITKFLKEYNHDPVSGSPMNCNDIIKLHVSKTSEGKWQCPVTYKTFTNASHIVAVAVSGYVYSYDAVHELNIKCKNFKDLITGESFKKSDIVTIQNVNDKDQMAKRDVSNFVHLKKIRLQNSETVKQVGLAKFRSDLQ